MFRDTLYHSEAISHLSLFWESLLRILKWITQKPRFVSELAVWLVRHNVSSFAWNLATGWKNLWIWRKSVSNPNFHTINISGKEQMWPPPNIPCSKAYRYAVIQRKLEGPRSGLLYNFSTDGPEPQVQPHWRYDILPPSQHQREMMKVTRGKWNKDWIHIPLWPNLTSLEIARKCNPI